MASYKILIKASAAKELELLPKPDRKRVADKILALAADPRPVGVQKLAGEDQYRLRQGDYRIIYEIIDREVLVLVIKIGHRREVYR